MDASQDSNTVFLMVVNICYGCVYVALFVVEAIRSYLDFQRLEFSQKVNLAMTAVMAALTLAIMFAKFSR